MCKAAFITEVFDFMANSVLGLQIMPELQCLEKKRKKKSVHQPGKKKIYIYIIFLKNENALLFTKVPTRPTKTGGSYVSVFDLIFFFLYIFYLLECAHILCKHCCSLFLIFKVTFLAIVSLEKWHSLLWAPKRK